MLVFPGPSPLPPPSLPQPATNADAESEGKLEPPESELHAVVETDSEADAAASAVAPPPRPFSQSQRPRGRRRGRATRGKPTSKGARRMAVTSQPEGCRGESFKPFVSVALPQARHSCGLSANAEWMAMAVLPSFSQHELVSRTGLKANGDPQVHLFCTSKCPGCASGEGASESIPLHVWVTIGADAVHTIHVSASPSQHHLLTPVTGFPEAANCPATEELHATDPRAYRELRFAKWFSQPGKDASTLVGHFSGEDGVKRLQQHAPTSATVDVLPSATYRRRRRSGLRSANSTAGAGHGPDHGPDSSEGDLDSDQEVGRNIPWDGLVRLPTDSGAKTRRAAQPYWPVQLSRPGSSTTDIAPFAEMDMVAKAFVNLLTTVRDDRCTLIVPLVQV
jgi:hypothetical protein